MYVSPLALCVGSALILFAGVGIYHVALAIILAARTPKQEPQIFERVMPDLPPTAPVSPGWAFGTDYHLLVEPPPLEEDLARYDPTPWRDSGFEGEPTGSLPVLDLPEPEPVVGDEPDPPARARFSKHKGKSKRQLTAIANKPEVTVGELLEVGGESK